ncbi:MAG: hypothetical protein WDW38_001207 [Sanguina aurantia]
MPRTVVARVENVESDSTDEEEDDDGEEQHVDEVAEANQIYQQHQFQRLGGMKKIVIPLNSQVCKVCGRKGHKAGFVGSVYMDCPFKPCYLCKKIGHTTATCPFKCEPGHGCTAAAATSTMNLSAALMARERGERVRTPPNNKPPRYQVDAAILKLHTRRCCCLEFHPTHDGIVLSGDKKGHLGIWNFDKVHDRTVYDTVHQALLNTMRFMDSEMLATASSDGTAKVIDIETGAPKTLINLNPGGWVEGAPWVMMYGLDVVPSMHLIVAGDSEGVVHMLDPRSQDPVGRQQLGKKGTKISSVACHPRNESIIMTAGNDHFARIFDIRAFSSNGAISGLEGGGSGGGASVTAAPPLPDPDPDPEPARKVPAGKGGGAPRAARVVVQTRGELASLAHPRVVNAAYFSPHTGGKILTTCQDNRLRVWDHAVTASGYPDREIVHSHDFNRYLTHFKAEFDPKDPTESRIVIGRYISEDFDGQALHPVDILDISSGALLQQCIDTNLTTISPVNKPHPRRDIIITGSARSLYLWAPVEEDEETEGLAAAATDGASTSHAAAAAAAAAHRGKKKASATGLGGSSAAAAAAREMVRRASKSFVYFDSDPDGGAGKRKGGGGGGKKKGGPPDDDDD